MIPNNHIINIRHWMKEIEEELKALAVEMNDKKNEEKEQKVEITVNK